MICAELVQTNKPATNAVAPKHVLNPIFDPSLKSLQCLSLVIPHLSLAVTRLPAREIVHETERDQKDNSQE
jgi:hypothetical protein